MIQYHVQGEKINIIIVVNFKQHKYELQVFFPERMESALKILF